MIEALISNLDKSRHLNQKEIEYLSDYLMRSEIWGYYELSLFRNTMRELSITTVITLSKELITTMQIYKEIDKTFSELIRILLNTINVCLERDRFKEALLFIKTLENLLQNTDKFYEKTELLFVKGIYSIKEGRKEEGVRYIKKSISILENLEAYRLASNYVKFVDKVKNM